MQLSWVWNSVYWNKLQIINNLYVVNHGEKPKECPSYEQKAQEEWVQDIDLGIQEKHNDLQFEKQENP